MSLPFFQTIDSFITAFIRIHIDPAALHTYSYIFTCIPAPQYKSLSKQKRLFIFLFYFSFFLDENNLFYRLYDPYGTPNRARQTQNAHVVMCSYIICAVRVMLLSRSVGCSMTWIKLTQQNIIVIDWHTHTLLSEWCFKENYTRKGRIGWIF